MAKHNYYLKDKKIDLYKGVSVTIKGVTKTTYSLLLSNLWAYYKQDNGSSSVTSSMTIKVYDTTERAVFVINRRPELRQETLSKLKVVYNGRIYDIDRIDDYEGYKEDYKLICKYSSTQSYDGIPVPNN